jgi:hypothetical protein
VLQQLFSIALAPGGNELYDLLFGFHPFWISFFSITYELLNLQVLCFDNHPTVPGVWGYPTQSAIEELKNPRGRVDDRPG